jgi:hypothetical protein
VNLIAICITVIRSACFPLTEQGERVPMLNYLSTVPMRHMREWMCSSTILDSALDRGECLASCFCCLTLNIKESPRYPLDGRLGGPHSWFGLSGEVKNLTLPEIQTGPFSPEPDGIPTDLSQLQCNEQVVVEVNILKFKLYIVIKL